MEQLHTILSDVLLAFQLLLGLWQIVKLTPVGGLVKGGMGWVLSLLPFRLSRDYALLQHRPGLVFKEVKCLVLTKAPELHDELTRPGKSEDISEMIEFSYLLQDFRLERGGNKLFVNGKMTHYITDAIWHNLQPMEDTDEDYVFVKGYKRFWEFMVTGGVMKLSETLDCVILENQTMMASDSQWLLPVNLSLSEEKIIKILNLVGLFLQTKKVFWLIPTLMSFASAMLEFNTRLRAWLYRAINKVFCWSMHRICDKLSYSKRRQLYSLGNWVENVTPCNDIELRVVRGDVCAVIAGGAKAKKGDAALVSCLNLEEGETYKTFHCDLSFDMICQFVENQKKCGLHVRYSNNEGAVELASVDVECNSREEFKKMCTLVYCMAKHRSGSLKSYDGHKKVEVRGWKESAQHYVKCGHPRIYELNLEDVIVDNT